MDDYVFDVENLYTNVLQKGVTFSDEIIKEIENEKKRLLEERGRFIEKKKQEKKD